MCVCAHVRVWARMEKEKDFKELVHVMMEACKFKICRGGQQAGKSACYS